MNLETFKKIQKQVADLEKTGMKFDITVAAERPWEKNCSSGYFEPTFYEVDTMSQLSQLQQVLGRSVPITSGNNPYGNSNAKVVLKDVKLVKTVTNLSDAVTDERSFMVLRKEMPQLRYFSPNLKNVTNFRPMVISHPPIEKFEDGITYRYVGTPDSCEMCVPHTSELYVYLDKGFVYAKVNRLGDKDKIVITNEMTPDSYLVLFLTHLQPAFAKQFEHECFLNFNKAKLLRIKFEKELKPENKAAYDRVKEVLLKDYEKSVNSNMIIKVVNGELPTATYNRIKLTKNSALYEGVSIEFPGLLPFLNEKMIFDDRTDIYNIIDSFIKAKIEELDSTALPAIAEGETEATLSATFKINDIDIVIKRTTANTRRSINTFHINKEELSEVCYRASCLNGQETFDKFVKSVHSMSLKWHDAIGNGIPVKIHDALTVDEYASASPPTTCPRIKFSKEEDNVYLITGTGEKDRAPIKLNAAIKQVAALNRKINNKYSQEYGYTPRNAAWGRRQLAKVLKHCCTFSRKELIVDAEGEPVLLNEKRQYNTINECKLSDEQASFIGKMSLEYYDKAIKRSSLFLAEAVKKTNARSIAFQGEDCWYVEGTLHKYAVSKKTNAVYNFERGNHICIVEPGHRVEVGFDATACRLLALKNDSVRVGQIGTLAHG